MRIKMHLNKALAGAFALALSLGVIPAAFAQEAEAAAETAPLPASDLKVNPAADLRELLRNVEQRRVVESRQHTEREAQFARDKAAQANLLSQARNQRAGEEQRSERLETQFQETRPRSATFRRPSSAAWDPCANCSAYCSRSPVTRAACSKGRSSAPSIRIVASG
jgi:hypothetical protein